MQVKALAQSDCCNTLNKYYHLNFCQEYQYYYYYCLQQSIVCFLIQEWTSLQHLLLVLLNHTSRFQQPRCKVPKAAKQLMLFCLWEKDTCAPAGRPARWLSSVCSWRCTSVLPCPGTCSPSSLPLPLSNSSGTEEFIKNRNFDPRFEQSPFIFPPKNFQFPLVSLPTSVLLGKTGTPL